MRDLADAGVAAFADDGKPVADADLLLHALRYARGTGRPILLHLENRSLSLMGSCTKASGAPAWVCAASPRPAKPGPLARDLEMVRYA